MIKKVENICKKCKKTYLYSMTNNGNRKFVHATGFCLVSYADLRKMEVEELAKKEEKTT